jgi:choline dehydrogenase-like flavoprotein
MGCGSCEKQGPVVSFLPDAAKAGAHFMEGLDVTRILFAQRNGKKVATGVEGIWTSRDEHGGVAGTPLVRRKVIIKAKRVIVSAGTMQSPLVLLRSGLKNRWIGRNLRLHPVSFVGAIYDEEVRPWEGGILTAVVNEFENQDQQGHGTKLEAVTMMPTGWLSFLAWTGGVDYKLLAPRMKNMVGHFAIQRDCGSGQVYADPHDGRPRFVYAPTKKDRVHLMEGMIACAKINYVMGAREIFTCLPGTSIFTRPAGQAIISAEKDEAFQTWLKEVRKRGLPDPDTIFTSAHQMGTCRMASSAKKGVVDSKGKVFGVDEGLYVADASVFPSASGVNPMVTNMALSDWLSRNIAKDLRLGTSMRASL